MAEIFRASVGPDPANFEVEVAIKRLHAHLVGDKVQEGMFLTEADVTKFLDHPNVIHVFESSMVGEVPYIAMEYVWGLDLARLMDLLRARSSRFPADLAVYVTMQVLRGLDYIHRATGLGGEPLHMVHRDITPSNLFITFGGQVKIGDFGVARVAFLESHEEERFVKGKPAYIPPEVLVGAEVSPRDDLWGLSVCLFEMLTGRPMDEGIDEDDLRMGRVKLRMPRLRRLNADIDPRLEKILTYALHPNPKKRPPDAYTYYRQLKAYLRGEGIEVGSEALARFVRSAVGVNATAPGPKIAGVNEAFDRSGYHAPVGPSMTQRMMVVEQRRRRWLIPAVAGGALAIGAGVWWLLS